MPSGARGRMLVDEPRHNDHFEDSQMEFCLQRLSQHLRLVDDLEVDETCLRDCRQCWSLASSLIDAICRHSTQATRSWYEVAAFGHYRGSPVVFLKNRQMLVKNLVLKRSSSF